MTENATDRFMLGLVVLVASAIIIAEGVYQALQDHSGARSSTFVLVAVTCLAAVAPSFYGFRWLRGWRSWLLVLLSLPFLALVAMTVWRLYQKAL